jgi:hypothetical protein
VLRGIIPCGFLHTVCNCALLFPRTVSFGVAGKCALSDGGVGIGVLGGVWGGGVYGWPSFSRASKILFGDMKCSSFRWLFLENSA